MELLVGVSGVVVSFSQTTENWAKTYLANIPSPLVGYYFVSAGIPSALKVDTSRGNVEYQTLKQRAQYDFIYKKLCSHEFDSFTEGFVMIEQTKLGSLHFHCVVKALDSNKHDIRADFFCAFGMTKGKNLKYSFKVDEVTNIIGLTDYLFNKKEKSYEKVDSIIFKPLKIYSHKLMKSLPTPEIDESHEMDDEPFYQYDKTIEIAIGHKPLTRKQRDKRDKIELARNIGLDPYYSRPHD